MLPESSRNFTEIKIEEIPSKDYKLKVDDQRIKGTCEGFEEMSQVIFKILNTERYQNIIYSWNYGVETVDLYGRPFDYVIPELKRRIKEALIQDDRINDVRDFEFETTGNKITTYFTVITTFGEVGAEKVVNI
jgi:hypothetical protein